MSDTVAGAILGGAIGGFFTLVGVLGTLFLQNRQTRSETQRWFAEFYLPREIEAVSNLYAALTGLYNTYYHRSIKLMPEHIESLKSRITKVTSDLPLDEHIQKLKKQFPNADPAQMEETFKRIVSTELSARITNSFLLDEIYSDPTHLADLQESATIANQHYTQCRALATVYLDPTLEHALDDFERTHVQLIRYLHRLELAPTTKSPEVPWDALREPYEHAVGLLRERLNPKTINKIPHLR